MKVLQGFARDKSPSSDAWMVEFYLAFFELLGP